MSTRKTAAGAARVHHYGRTAPCRHCEAMGYRPTPPPPAPDYEGRQSTLGRGPTPPRTADTGKPDMTAGIADWALYHPVQVVLYIVGLITSGVGVYYMLVGHPNSVWALTLGLAMLGAPGAWAYGSREAKPAPMAPLTDPLAVLRELYATDAIGLDELERCTGEVLAGLPLRCPAASAYMGAPDPSNRSTA